MDACGVRRGRHTRRNQRLLAAARWNAWMYTPSGCSEDGETTHSTSWARRVSEAGQPHPRSSTAHRLMPSAARLNEPASASRALPSAPFRGSLAATASDAIDPRLRWVTIEDGSNGTTRGTSTRLCMAPPRSPLPCPPSDYGVPAPNTGTTNHRRTSAASGAPLRL